MLAVAGLGESLGCDNPKLQFISQGLGVSAFTIGRLRDVYSLAFAVYDVSTEDYQVAPIEKIARTDVALDDCPIGERIGLGRYVASFEVDVGWNTGRYEIRWYYKMSVTDAEKMERYEFDVIGEINTALTGPIYALPSDLATEGFTTETDAFVLSRLILASRYIERVTGRFFEPRYLTLNFSGNGSNKLLLNMPIVAIESVQFETSPYDSSTLEVDADLIRVYNRHLSQGLTMPDDRNNPKLELYYSRGETNRSHILSTLVFPDGQQNIIVNGVFGYTDPNGSMAGGVPDLIRYVCKLLVLRDRYRLANQAAREDAMKRFRIKSEKTRDQSYTLDSLAQTGLMGSITGDADIDNILHSYMRPPLGGGT